MAVTDPETLARLNAKSSGQSAQPDFMKNRSATDNFLAGVGSGMVNVGRNAVNMLLPESLEPEWATDEAIARQKEMDRALLDTGAGTAGRFVGEVAATAPLGAGTVGLAAKVGSKVPALTRTMQALNSTGAGRVAARTAGYGTEGAVEGAVLADPNNRFQGAVEGAAWGAGTGNLIDGAGKAIQGARGTPAAQQLLSEGVDLTPAQMNPTGAMAAIEESVAGKFNPAVQNARQAAVHQTVEAMGQRARPPLLNGKRKDVPIRAADLNDLTNKLYDEFGVAYDAVRGHPANAGDIRSQYGYFADRTAGITDDVRKAEKDWLLNETSRLNHNGTNTDELLQLRSNIRSRIRDKYRKGETDVIPMLERAEAYATSRIDNALKDYAGLQKHLKDTDAAYSKFKIIEDLSYRSGDAAPTPHKMSQAVKSAESSKGSYARGGGQMRDITKAANETFAVGTPKTGMANFVPMATAGIGATLGLPYFSGAALPAVITGIAAGTKTGRKLYRGETAPQAALAKAINALGLKDEMAKLTRTGAVVTNDEN